VVCMCGNSSSHNSVANFTLCEANVERSRYLKRVTGLVANNPIGDRFVVCILLRKLSSYRAKRKHLREHKAQNSEI